MEYQDIRDFIESLNLPDGISAKKFNGMNRIHFKYNGAGFLIIDLKNDSYNLGSREEYLKAVGVLNYEISDNYGPNRALIRNIPYDDTEILLKLIDYIQQGTVSNINVPKKPKNVIRKPDGSVIYICGRCGKSYLQSHRCPECGQLVKE